jgi:hypothetical protein
MTPIQRRDFGFLLIHNKYYQRVVAAAGLAVVASGYFLCAFRRLAGIAAWHCDDERQCARRSHQVNDAAPGNPLSVELSDKQLASVKVEPVGEREFAIEKESVGSIDFNARPWGPGARGRSAASLSRRLGLADRCRSQGGCLPTKHVRLRRCPSAQRLPSRSRRYG